MLLIGGSVVLVFISAIGVAVSTGEKSEAYAEGYEYGYSSDAYFSGETTREGVRENCATKVVSSVLSGGSTWEESDDFCEGAADGYLDQWNNFED